MLNLSRYPKFNDSPHNRPTLSMYGRTVAGEIAWVAIPIIVLAFALLLR
jgi:hypothetical protein